MSVSSRRSNGPVLRSTKFNSPLPTPSSSSFASSISSTFSSSRSTPTLRRTASPPPVNLQSPSTPSLRFPLDRPISPTRSLSVASCNNNQVAVKKPLANQKRTCMCSPTTHPGSFRCSFHKNLNDQKLSFPSNRLNARRSAMTNSLVRIGTVEGDLVRRALAALIRPSSHQQRRRACFQPRPSRLSIVSNSIDV